jgi:hypothetical protein
MEEEKKRTREEEKKRRREEEGRSAVPFLVFEAPPRAPGSAVMSAGRIPAITTSKGLRRGGDGGDASAERLRARKTL